MKPRPTGCDADALTTTPSRRSNRMDLDSIINQIIQKTHRKMKSTILICNLFQAKHLEITQEKDDGVKMVLSYRRGRDTYDLNVEAISFAIGQGCRSSQLI